MRIASVIPQLLARITDLVQRDVESNLDIEQSVNLVLTPPRAIRPSLGPGFNQLQTDSTFFQSSQRLLASSGTLVQNDTDLEKGVWHISGVAVYTATYQDLLGPGYTVSLLPFTGSIIPILAANPNVGTFVLPFDVVVTLDQPHTLRESLQATGVGQTHGFNSSWSLQRLL